MPRVGHPNKLTTEQRSKLAKDAWLASKAKLNGGTQHPPAASTQYPAVDAAFAKLREKMAEMTMVQAEIAEPQPIKATVADVDDVCPHCNGSGRVKPVLATVGQRLRYVRRQQSLSHEQLQAKCGITPYVLNRFETGSLPISMDSMFKLCTVLNVSADYLLGLST